MLGEADIAALIERFGRGNLDAELQEKVRAMSPNLGPNNFRFLADMGLKAHAHTFMFAFVSFQ